MIYGELGRLPVSITIKLRMAGFWGKMLTGKQQKLSYNLYQMILSDWVNVKWISKIKNILDESGLSDIWDMQFVHCAVNLMEILKLNFKDQFLQQWNSEMQVSNKGKMYSMLKKGFEMENYLKTNPLIFRNSFAGLELRITAYQLKLEDGQTLIITYANATCVLLVRLGTNTIPY